MRRQASTLLKVGCQLAINCQRLLSIILGRYQLSNQSRLLVRLQLTAQAKLLHSNNELDVPKMWSNEKKPILGHFDLGHFVLDRVNMTAFLLDAMSTQTADLSWLKPSWHRSWSGPPGWRCRPFRSRSDVSYLSSLLHWAWTILAASRSCSRHFCPSLLCPRHWRSAWTRWPSALSSAPSDRTAHVTSLPLVEHANQAWDRQWWEVQMLRKAVQQLWILLLDAAGNNEKHWWEMAEEDGARKAVFHGKILSRDITER